MKATVAVIPAIRPMVDQAKVDRSRPRGFAAEQRVALAGDLVDGALQFGDRGVVFAGFLGGGEAALASDWGPPSSA